MVKLSARALLKLIAFAVGALVGICPSAAAPPAGSELAAFSQFYSVSKDRAEGWPVRVRAVVVCSDLGWNQLYLHDGQGVIYLNPQLFQTHAELGQSVEVTGKLTLASGSPNLTNAHMRVLGAGTMPKAKRLE